MGKLDEKVAIVTGAARGLGRAYAKRLAGLGARVAVADLNLRSYEEFEAEAKDMTSDSTVAEIEASGGIALGIEVDVRDHEAVEAMVARVVREWGRVDVLVANAGGGRGRPMDTKASTLDPALLQLVVEMNLFGTVYSCNAVARIMKQQRSGKIITVSSVAGTAPSADGGYVWSDNLDGTAATIRMRIWCRGDDMIVAGRWWGQAVRGTESRVCSCGAVTANHAQSRVAARLRRSHRGRDQGWPGGRHRLRHRG